MSNYHLLRQDSKKDEVTVVFHVPISSQNNFAGVSLQTALKEMLESETEAGIIGSQCPFIQAAELTQLQNGELYEHVEVVKFDANLSQAEKRNIIDSRFAELTAIVAARVANELDFWGYSRDVT